MKHLVTILALVGLAACTPPANQSASTKATNVLEQGTVVATVDGQPVTKELISFYGKARFGTDEIDEAQTTQIMDDVTQLMALVSEAKRQGIDKDSETALRLKMQEMSALAQIVLQKFSENNPVSDADIQAAYDAGSFGSEYKARHILVKEESEATSLIEQLTAGGEFEALAKENSIGPSADKGGDLGWFPAAQMVKPFADALPTIEPGNFSKEPVQTQFGWHVILVEETRKQGFDQVKGQIKEKLTNDQVTAFLDRIKNGATVVKTPIS